ncbi:hypothetical protein CD30_04515 [Ureibacillus massiliensis 4400831 = CIP 108448 = CCUG 49529]|uniref:Uncharacterized protein n=1 Tax=Ureibacillus massiliensis 4400831 = CIP 108448 = CCUG 49529 TaxID=1211035 RepID=A0A0A3JX39_9BACL|nr:hypothetical protein [Ureibacillus massiliensis]KGR91577.1 hypothetical protein CD30_04515 [Ureibacillus massiliensis 4400831 = CIP 108448 = CCUG 49529]
MRKFVGLIGQEHRHYGLFNYVMAGLVGLVVFLGPVVIAQVFPNENYYDVNNIRFGMTIIAAVFIGILSIAMFTSSLNRDIKTKELWLHNNQTIYALIGAKIVYHGISLIVLNIIAFIGFFFVGDLIVGTIMQYLIFGIACLIIVTMTYLFFIVVVLFLTGLKTQLARYIGKLSYVVMFITVILLLELLNRLPNFTFLQIGKVQLSSLNAYLPTFADTKMDISLFHDFYLVEEIVASLVFILIYILSCKWIERVITR